MLTGREDHSLDGRDRPAEIRIDESLALRDEAAVVAVDDQCAVGLDDRRPPRGDRTTAPESRFVQSISKFERIVFTVPSEYVHVWMVPELCTWIGNAQVSELAGITRVRSQGVVVCTGAPAQATGTSTRASIAATKTFFILISRLE